MHTQHGAYLAVHQVDLQIARIERGVVGQAEAALPFRGIAQQRDALARQLAHALIIQVQRAIPQQHGHLAARLKMQLRARLCFHAVGGYQRQVHAVDQVQPAQIDAHRLVARARGGQRHILRLRRVQRQRQHEQQGQAAANGPSFAKHDQAASFFQPKRTVPRIKRALRRVDCRKIHARFGRAAQRYGTMPCAKWQASHASTAPSYPDYRARGPLVPECR